MANVAQLCNNLHSLYLTGGDHFVETPTYYVFDMYKTHQDGRHVNTLVTAEQTLSASASEKDDVLTITVANLDLTEKNIKIASIGGSITGEATIAVLSHKEPRTCNTFENPTAVTPITQTRSFGPEEIVAVPAAGIVSIMIHGHRI